ncbi:hypothetical protein X798_03368 [Onchocerca flexuosa]|uniref:Uncharacterized protein n=1 Tax=Onchocerca flexuosa TaxID=387005 RepID=A0A238BXB1_9BILA|nr:hypothetical protein X798_03368 [Onchocerca flexuosa]
METTGAALCRTNALVKSILYQHVQEIEQETKRYRVCGYFHFISPSILDVAEAPNATRCEESSKSIVLSHDETPPEDREKAGSIIRLPILYSYYQNIIFAIL